MKSAGITIAEILVVIGIVMFLAAISYSPITAAIQSAHKSQCVSNLKQLHLAISLYRQEYGGEGIYGDSYSMGLPPDDVRKVIREFVTLRCAEAGNDMFTTKGVHYYSFWIEPELDGTIPPWSRYAVEWKGESILVADMNHNSKEIPIMQEDLRSRFGMGVRENGSLAQIRKPGDWMINTWWN